VRGAGIEVFEVFFSVGSCLPSENGAHRWQLLAIDSNPRFAIDKLCYLRQAFNLSDLHSFHL